MFQLTCDVLGLAGFYAKLQSRQPAVTQLDYTTLIEHTYSLVANNLTLSIMEQTFERYNERNLSDLLIETDDEYIELYLEWKKEHPMQMATPMPEWI